MVAAEVHVMEKTGSYQGDILPEFVPGVERSAAIEYLLSPDLSASSGDDVVR
jgi:hypothetical protein